MSSIVMVHTPSAVSPQVITDMKLQLWKPFLDLSSFLGASIWTLLPEGDFRYTSSAPLTGYEIVVVSSTCSRYRRWLVVPLQPVVGIWTVVGVPKAIVSLILSVVLI